MKKTKVLLLIPLMLLAPIFGIAYVHAATPQVCVTAPPAKDCTSPATFNSATLTPGSTISVAVNVQDAPSINAFSVSIQTDGSVLRGIDVLTGVITGTPGGICIDGFPFPSNGDNKCTVNDGLGIVTVTQTLPSGGSFSGSGTLFTIDYQVVGVSGGMPIGFSQACPGSSNAPNCVTLVGNGALVTGVSLTPSHFENQFDYTFNVSPAFQSFQSSGSGSISVSMSPLGLFSGMVTVSNGASPAGLSCTPASTSVNLPATVTLTCTGSNGDYMVTVSGSAAGVSAKSTTVEVIVSAPDFQFKASTNSLSVDQGSFQSATFTAVPLSGFSSVVSVAVSGPTVSGLTLGLSSNIIPGASGSVTLTATNTNAAVGTYSYMVTGTSGSIQHSQPLAVTVPAPDFQMVAVPGVESEVPVGASGSTVVQATSLHGFSGTVTITAQLVPNGIVGSFVGPMNVLFSPTVQVTPTTPGSSSVSVTYPKNVALGNYTVIFTGTSGPLTHTVPFNFTLVDFSSAITKTVYHPTPCAPRPGARYPSACRDGGFIIVGSLGGKTGFGISTLGSTFVGYNCINTPIAAINPFGNTCVDFKEYWPNGTLVPKAAIKAGLAPILQFTPRIAFPVPNDSIMCLLFSAGSVGLIDPIGFPSVFPTYVQLSSIYNTSPGSFATGFNGFNAGNQTDLPQSLDPTAPPGGTGLPCDGTDVDFVRTFAFPQTIPGDYKVFIDVAASVLDHPIGNVTIIVPQPPQFTQLVFKHHLSFSAEGGVQSIKLGITNPNNDTSITAFVRATIVGNGVSISSVTATMTLAPGQTINNLAITIPLNPSFIGQTFTLKVTIFWGNDSKSPRATSTIPATPDIPTTGTFTVFP